jgi:hypothetical protein
MYAWKSVLSSLLSLEAEELALEFKRDYPYPAETLLEISALEEIGLDTLRTVVYSYFPAPTPEPVDVIVHDEFPPEEFPDSVINDE